MGADAPGISERNEPASAQSSDFDGQATYLPCRFERTGAGPLPVHRFPDDGRQGRD